MLKMSYETGCRVMSLGASCLVVFAILFLLALNPYKTTSVVEYGVAMALCAVAIVVAHMIMDKKHAEWLEPADLGPVTDFLADRFAH